MNKYILISILFLLLIYTRFVNLGWGLPYPFHPDERNMANAVQSLNCEASHFTLQIPRDVFDISNCLNPHFFAYGQFPLYLAYFGILAQHFFSGNTGQPITFIEATMALRIISALASIANVLIVLKIVLHVMPNLFRHSKKILKQVQDDHQSMKVWNNKFINHYSLIIILILIFTPYFIQFSHFGTTESLLMLFYSMIIYLSLKLYCHPGKNEVTDKISEILSLRSRMTTIIVSLSLISGLAIATKVSAVFFVMLPIIVLLKITFGKAMQAVIASDQRSNLGIAASSDVRRSPRNDKLINLKSFMFHVLCFMIITGVVAILFSPHNLISFREFMNSITYESAVGTGEIKVFYTRQFEHSVPILFQLEHIFPYVLGIPLFIVSVAGFFLLPLNKSLNILRIALLIYFLPNAFLYAKWTRFIAPVFPLMTIFGILMIFKLRDVMLNLFQHLKKNIEIPKPVRNDNLFFHLSSLIIILIVIIPGIAYLSIYQHTDVRFQASKWIYTHISSNMNILSETANVVDLPMVPPGYDSFTPNYHITSFDFYNVDQEANLQVELSDLINTADYIFVPSRRIFRNLDCLSGATERNDRISEILSSLMLLQDDNCQYPILHNYYAGLFSGSFGYKKIVEFNSYPKIEVLGKTLFEFPDENAEETWTVFDHPVIRIYKKGN